MNDIIFVISGKNGISLENRLNQETRNRWTKRIFCLQGKALFVRAYGHIFAVILSWNSFHMTGVCNDGSVDLEKRRERPIRPDTP